MVSEPLPAGSPIDPLVCPRGHHNVTVGTDRIYCQTCQNQGYETRTWDRSELVDLRESEPPLADGRRVATDGGQPTDGVPSEDFCLIDAIDYDGGRSEHGLTKEEIKKKFIRDALEKLATRDLEYFRAMSVNAKIHSRLHDGDVFERNIDPYSIPELSDIKQFLKKNSDLGFATISYSDEFEMWAFETSNEADERSTDD